MIQEYDPTSLDPLEQLIYSRWKTIPVLQNVFGPYFDWNMEKQGLPFAVIIPSGGDGPNLYDMNKRGVINQASMRFDIWHTDRAGLKTILQAVTPLFERLANADMLESQVCLSCLAETRWHTTFEQAKNNALNTNAWHSMACFRFRVEKRTTGVL